MQLFTRRRGLSRAQVEAEIAEASDWAGFLATMDPSLAASSTVVANTVYLANLNTAVRTGPIDGLTHMIGATNPGSQVDAGLYTFDGTTFTRIRQSGVVAAAAINTDQRMAFTAHTPVPGERLYSAITFDTAITVFGRALGFPAAVAIGQSTVMKAAAWASGLPATITATANTNLIVFQVAD